MARNRKRAKERRARHPQEAGVRRSLSASGSGAPDPIAHASPDVELAETQLAVGRMEVGRVDDAPIDEEEFEAEAELAAERVEGGGDRDGGAPPRGGALAVPAGGGGGGAVAPRVPAGSRLIGFLQGSWRELQRVQWPDRRQVVQATGVVIGFVIVAGIWLGVADTLSTKLMDFILK